MKWYFLVYPPICLSVYLRMQNETNEVISQMEVRIIDIQINANDVLSWSGTEKSKLQDIRGKRTYFWSVYVLNSK